MFFLKTNLKKKACLSLFLVLLAKSQLLSPTNDKKNQALIRYNANKKEQAQKKELFDCFIAGNTLSQKLIRRIEELNFSDLIDLSIMYSPEDFLRMVPGNTYDLLPGEIPSLSITDLVKLKYNENFARAILNKKEGLSNPLHFATKQNSLRQVLSIIDCAAKFNINISPLLIQKNIDGETPFSIARQNKSFKILAVLKAEASGEEIFINYLKKHSFKDLIDWPDGSYLLSYILRKNFTKTQAYLLNITKQFGNTILHHTALTKNMSAFMLILEIIKSLNLNLRDYIFLENDYYQTPYDILKEKFSNENIKKILGENYEILEKINNDMLITVEGPTLIDLPSLEIF